MDIVQNLVLKTVIANIKLLMKRSVAATRREIPDSIPSRVLGNFHATFSFCPHSVVLESTQRLTEVSIKEFRWGWSAAGAGT